MPDADRHAAVAPLGYWREAGLAGMIENGVIEQALPASHIELTGDPEFPGPIDQT